MDKIYITTDEKEVKVRLTHRIHKKGIFSEIKSGETCGMDYTTFNRVLNCSFKDIEIAELFDHIEIVMPFCLYFHEKNCYGEIFNRLKFNQSIENLDKYKELLPGTF